MKRWQLRKLLTAECAEKRRKGRGEGQRRPVERRLLSASTWQQRLVRRRVLSSHFPGL